MKNLPHIYCVLCECKNAGNMGAAARAIKNMGLEGLILVRPNQEQWLEGIKMATGAEDVLERAVVYNSIEPAVSDMHLVVGTTRRFRKHRLITFNPREIFSQIIDLTSDHKVAIVFGSERGGLTNHDLSFCQKVVTIPVSSALPSINLAQAVMIMAYEWHMTCQTKMETVTVKDKQREIAEAGQRHMLIKHMEEVLKRIGFMDKNPENIRLTLIDILSRLDLTLREVNILRGILSRAEYCLEKGENRQGVDEEGY